MRSELRRNLQGVVIAGSDALVVVYGQDVREGRTQLRIAGPGRRRSVGRDIGRNPRISRANVVDGCSRAGNQLSLESKIPLIGIPDLEVWVRIGINVQRRKRR